MKSVYAPSHAHYSLLFFRQVWLVVRAQRFNLCLQLVFVVELQLDFYCPGVSAVGAMDRGAVEVYCADRRATELEIKSIAVQRLLCLLALVHEILVANEIAALEDVFVLCCAEDSLLVRVGCWLLLVGLG